MDRSWCAINHRLPDMWGIGFVVLSQKKPVQAVSNVVPERGGKTEYSYDAMQHLTQVQSLKSDGTTNLAKFDYSYNTRDVRTSATKTLGGGSTQTINYTYDNIDQLTKELSTEQNPTLNQEYSYDAMGNRITSSASGASMAYTSNNLNQLTQTSVGGTNTTLTYDANGNTIQQGNKTFGYNDADQLTSVVIPNQKKSEFVYDSGGRKRISKEYTWDAANQTWTQADETRFIYDGMDLVQERGADGTVKASYVRDGNIGGVLSMTNADGTFTYHYDGSGNVVALTDANQNIVAQYSYDAFGNTLSASGAQAEKNPFRFSSKYYDGDTGPYDYGYRHYDSSLGRWINRDPMGEDGGLNLYGMVANDPINAVDLYGLETLVFDGRTLKWFYDNGVLRTQVPAYSGLPGRGAKDQGQVNAGPLPAGTYTIDPSQDMYWTDNWLAAKSRWSYQGGQQGRESWGDRRIPIRPAPGTNIRGRNPTGFYLHGGRYIGSQGCVDIGPQDIRIIDAIGQEDSTLKLIVKYPNWKGSVPGTPQNRIQWPGWK